MSTPASYVYRRFRINGKLLEVRNIKGETNPEVVVREVNDDDELSAHEYSLTLRFLLKYGTLIRRLA